MAKKRNDRKDQRYKEAVARSVAYQLVGPNSLEEQVKRYGVSDPSVKAKLGIRREDPIPGYEKENV
jgi:hypothetical protein